MGDRLRYRVDPTIAARTFGGRRVYGPCVNSQDGDVDKRISSSIDVDSCSQRHDSRITHARLQLQEPPESSRHAITEGNLRLNNSFHGDRTGHNR